MPLHRWVRGVVRRPVEDREHTRGERNLRQELDILAQDLRYNARVIRRAGPLSIAVVLTLSVGLGINSIVFSLFQWLAVPSVGDARSR